MKAIKLLSIAVAVLTLTSCGDFGVYMARKEGEGQLAKAESNRQIATLEAQARSKSAEFWAETEKKTAQAKADAEIIRAKGVAEANRIIGESLQNNEAYLKYLWIDGMKTNQMQVIYVPTEANLPILESTRLKK